LADDGIEELLRMAGVSPSNKKATAWLSSAIKGVWRNDKAAEKPLPADHNALLTDIEKSAKELIKRLERLRRNPFSRHTFWRCKAFGPVYNDRVEVREVLSTLETIVLAADMARDRRRGRRRKTREQQVVDLAFAFFVRFSPYQVSGTPTGRFAKFARSFYSAAIRVDPDKHRLDRQIRQAQTRLAIESERARRKSHEKSTDSS
jgi:hypothetical protein